MWLKIWGINSASSTIDNIVDFNLLSDLSHCISLAHNNSLPLEVAHVAESMTDQEPHLAV